MIKIRKLLLLLGFCGFFLSGSTAWAKSWYVRSATACANNGDGTASNCAASPGAVGGWSGLSNISWASIQPGDTLYLVSGDTYTAPLNIGKSGTVGNPITVSVTGGGTAIIDAQQTQSGIPLSGHSYVTVDGSYGNAAFGGSTAYGIQVKNIGPGGYCVYQNGTASNLKFLHLECKSTQVTSGICADNCGGYFFTGGVTFVEIGYGWIHSDITQYDLSSCSSNGTSTVCTTTANITDANWQAGSQVTVVNGNTGSNNVGNNGINGYGTLTAVTSNTFTFTHGAGAVTTSTGGHAAMPWWATGVSLFTVAGASTNFNDNTIHDTRIDSLHNDGFRCGWNCSAYHNEVSQIVGSGHSDSMQCQQASYCALYGNYVHDSNDQNIYLTNNATTPPMSHLRVFNNIVNSPGGIGINVDPFPGGPLDDIVIVNNTFIGTYLPSLRNGRTGSTAISNVVLLNNIWGKIYPGSGYKQLEFGPSSQWTFKDANSFDYNLYSTASSNYPTLVGWDSNLTLSGLRALSPAREVHGNVGIPNYVIAPTWPTLAAGDFHLSSSDTLARGTGVNLTSTYSFLSTDFDGNPRPSAGAWDLGAYASGGIVGSGPTPPANLSAVVQ